MAPPAVTSTLSSFPCQVKQRAISKQHLTGNALLFKSRPEFLSLLQEEAVVHGRLHSVFLVCPVSVMVVQPVDEHIIHLALKLADQPLGVGKDRCYHGKGPYPFQMEDCKGLDPLLYWWSTWFKELPYILVRRGYSEPD